MRFGKTKNEIENILANKGYSLISYYSKNLKLRVIICDQQGYKYDLVLSHICKKSHVHKNPNRVDVHNPYSLENISLWLIENNKPFSLTDNNKYSGSKSKLNLRCHKCNKTFVKIWESIWRGDGCYYCNGEKCSDFYNIVMTNEKYLKYWDYEKNTILPEEVARGSRKTVFWKCPVCLYEWKCDVHSMQDKTCSSCSGHVVTDKNSLALLFPEIIEEFDIIKNTGVDINNISFASCKKYWWLCKQCGKSWEASPHNRTAKRKTGCPHCNSSKAELIVEKVLKNANISYIHEYSIKYCKHIKPLFFDFAVFDKNNCLMGLIEADGEQHFVPIDFSGKDEEHAKKEFEKIKRRDSIKTKYCADNAIPLLRISYKNFNDIEEILTDYLNL